MLSHNPGVKTPGVPIAQECEGKHPLQDREQNSFALTPVYSRSSLAVTLTQMQHGVLTLGCAYNEWRNAEMRLRAQVHALVEQ